MKLNILSYSTVLFDCDGVVLNSNSIKTEAFRAVTLPFGTSASQAFVDFHQKNGGVSRYSKFKFFVDSILSTHIQGFAAKNKCQIINDLCDKFAARIKEGLIKCEVAPGLVELRHLIPMARWMIVSGGDQDELRALFTARGLAPHFDGGIYGSPKDKHAIVAELLKSGKLRRPAILLGDSFLDHDVAKRYSLDFIFISDWTDNIEWREYCEAHNILSICNIGSLLNSGMHSARLPPDDIPGAQDVH